MTVPFRNPIHCRRAEGDPQAHVKEAARPLEPWGRASLAYASSVRAASNREAYLGHAAADCASA